MRGQQIKSHKGKHGAARGPPGSFHERAGLPILDFGSCDLRRPAWPLTTKNNELLQSIIFNLAPILWVNPAAEMRMEIRRKVETPQIAAASD